MNLQKHENPWNNLNLPKYDIKYELNDIYWNNFVMIVFKSVLFHKFMSGHFLEKYTCIVNNKTHGKWKKTKCVCTSKCQIRGEMHDVNDY